MKFLSKTSMHEDPGHRVPHKMPFQARAIPSPHGGIPAGTPCLTRRGYRVVEKIAPGEEFITRSTGFSSCRKILRKTVPTKAIWFAAGSLGDGHPDCDVILPATQTVLIRDWRATALFGQASALLRAEQLVDEEFVQDLGQQELDLFWFEFDPPQIVYAGGLEISSYANQEGAVAVPASL